MTILSIFGYLHCCLNHEITTISNFCTSNNSLIKNSLFHEMSSISMKNHFFFALWMFETYQIILYGQTFFSTFNRDRNVFFLIYGYNQSSKCHETKLLKTSCSYIRFSSNVVVHFFAKLIWVVAVSIPKSHILIFCEDFDHSRIVSIFASIVLRS